MRNGKGGWETRGRCRAGEGMAGARQSEDMWLCTMLESETRTISSSSFAGASSTAKKKKHTQEKKTNVTKVYFVYKKIKGETLCRLIVRVRDRKENSDTLKTKPH